jgi:hypothetical protein
MGTNDPYDTSAYVRQLPSGYSTKRKCGKRIRSLPVNGRMRWHACIMRRLMHRFGSEGDLLAKREPPSPTWLTGRDFSCTCQGGHRPRYSTLAADACYWPNIGPIAGQARCRYSTLAADACYWLPLPTEREPVVTKTPPSQVQGGQGLGRFDGGDVRDINWWQAPTTRFPPTGVFRPWR